MALSNSQYETIMRRYDERQTKNRRILEKRTAEIYTNVEGYRELCESIATLSVAQGKKLLFGDEKALDELRGLIRNQISKKEQLLVNAGYPVDYLSPIFICHDCKDTGYIDGIKCHCFKQQEIEFLYEQSGIRSLLERENFSTLTYSYYEGESQESFKKIVEICKNFVNNFDSENQNLFFYGTVGTGKSFMSGCIAKELLDRGHSVIYFSAAALFENLVKNMFDFNKRDEMQRFHEDIYKCDLLVVDDLGTEYTNSAIAPEFFSLLNERHFNRKATIISTNLSLEGIRNRYTDRVLSRITERYIICKFIGPDIRMIKRMQKVPTVT